MMQQQYLPLLFIDAPLGLGLLVYYEGGIWKLVV